MSQDTLTHDETGHEPGADPERNVSPLEFLAIIYRFFYNKRVGLVLILAMGVSVLVGILFPQAPAEVRTDPTAFASWVDQVSPVFRGLTKPLAAIGFFGVFSSWWFLTITVLLALSILACSVHRTPVLWKRSMNPRVVTSASFFNHGRLRDKVELDVGVDEAQQRVLTALGDHKLRVITEPDGDDVAIYADQNRFAPFGTVVAHIAFDIILVGVLVSALAGFRIETFPVTVGQPPAEVGHNTGLSVAATDFVDEYTEEGRPLDYASDVILYHDGKEVASQTVRVNTPLRWGGVAFNQASFGESAIVKVTDSSGAVAYEGGVPLRSTTADGRNIFGMFSLPDQKLEIVVIAAAPGQVDQQLGTDGVLLQVFVDVTEDAAAAELFAPGDSHKLGTLTYAYEGKGEYTGLMVSRDPGAIWVWIGSILIMLGTTVTMVMRHRRLWVRIQPTETGSEVLFNSPDRPDVAFTNRFGEIVKKVGSDA